MFQLDGGREGRLLEGKMGGLVGEKKRGLEMWWDVKDRSKEASKLCIVW